MIGGSKNHVTESVQCQVLYRAGNVCEYVQLRPAPRDTDEELVENHGGKTVCFRMFLYFCNLAMLQVNTGEVLM